MNRNDMMDRGRRRVHRGAGQWADLIDAQLGSGLSIAAFCRAQGVATNSFYRWRRRLGGSSGERSGRGPFVRLRRSGGRGVAGGVDAGSAAWDRETVVVRFGDGVELHVGGGRLGELVAMLRECRDGGVVSGGVA